MRYILVSAHFTLNSSSYKHRLQDFLASAHTVQCSSSVARDKHNSENLRGCRRLSVRH